MLKKARIDSPFCKIYRKKNARDQRKRGSLSLDILWSAAEYTCEWSAAAATISSAAAAAATISSAAAAAATSSSAAENAACGLVAAENAAACSCVSCTASGASHVTLCAAT